MLLPQLQLLLPQPTQLELKPNPGGAAPELATARAARRGSRPLRPDGPLGCWWRIPGGTPHPGPMMLPGAVPTRSTSSGSSRRLISASGHYMAAAWSDGFRLSSLHRPVHGEHARQLARAWHLLQGPLFQRGVWARRRPATKPRVQRRSSTGSLRCPPPPPCAPPFGCWRCPGGAVQVALRMAAPGVAAPAAAPKMIGLAPATLGRKIPFQTVPPATPHPPPAPLQRCWSR
mmetsp:Transcript_13386/g.29776  ORF Transcript_13386/g.29776 Transcript_13386/m.29776 type:complete len:231 (+) Transcript_13386:410-1102(+)